MRRKLAAFLTATVAMGLSGSVFAQISTTDMTTLDADDLVAELLGPCVTVTPGSASYTGADVAAGTFSGASAVFGPGFDSGIVLSSGSIHLDCGPTNTFDGLTNVSVVNGTAGDGDLDTILNWYVGTYDAASLEFEFTCCGPVEQMSFVFVFASEEYNEFVENPFGWYDGFGFFVNGVNKALVPVAPFPQISIDSINRGYSGDYGNPVWSTNPGFYRNNVEKDGIDGITYLGYNDWQNLPIAMDGMTVLMALDEPLVGLGPHTIKIAIADVDDSFNDSAVFLFAGSFTCGSPLSVELGDFAGRVDRTGNVLLGWNTLSEIDNAGFNLWREPWSDRHLIAPSPGSILINEAVIPARGNPFETTPYRWFDLSSQRGKVYHYWLEDIANDGVSTYHGPFVIR